MSRSALRASAAVLALALAAGSASAATTFSGSFAVDTTGPAFVDPGLVVSVAPTSGTGSFALDLGQSFTFNVFDLWTNEADVGKDDTKAETISVAFTLTSPAAGSTVINGTTVGQSSFWGIVQNGKLAWDAPATLSFGNGGALSIALSGGTFNKGLFGLNEGPCFGLDVYATVTYTAASQDPTPAPVPLPAAGGVLAAGLGALAAVRRKA